MARCSRDMTHSIRPHCNTLVTLHKQNVLRNRHSSQYPDSTVISIVKRTTLRSLFRCLGLDQVLFECPHSTPVDENEDTGYTPGQRQTLGMWTVRRSGSWVTKLRDACGGSFFQATSRSRRGLPTSGSGRFRLTPPTGVQQHGEPTYTYARLIVQIGSPVCCARIGLPHPPHVTNFRSSSLTRMDFQG